MAGKKLAVLLAAVLILGLAACGGRIPSEDAVQTALAKTFTEEKKMENALNATLTALGKGGAQETPLPGTVTLTTAMPTATLTHGVVTVSVSVDTWCSKGPGPIYDRVFILYIGQTAEVIGRDEFGNYWIIKKPDNPDVTCWLWAKYATITGDASSLPVIPAPPTPTAPPSRVTAVSISVADPYIDSGDSNCSHTQDYTYSITTDGPVTVKFTITMVQDGQEWGTTGIWQMVFTSAGTQTVNKTWDFWHCGNWVFTIITHYPNVMTAKATYKVVP